MAHTCGPASAVIVVGVFAAVVIPQDPTIKSIGFTLAAAAEMQR